MKFAAAATLFASANAWGYDTDPYSFIGLEEFGFSRRQSAYQYGGDNMPQWADPRGSMARNDPWFSNAIRYGDREESDVVQNTDIFSFGKIDDQGADIQPFSQGINTASRPEYSRRYDSAYSGVKSYRAARPEKVENSYESNRNLYDRESTSSDYGFGKDRYQDQGYGRGYGHDSYAEDRYAPASYDRGYDSYA